MTTAILTPTLGEIEPGVLYPIECFKSRTGFKNGALRSMRAQGLRVMYLSGRAFIRGQDFLEFAERTAKSTKAG
jgi:hypothetical protein